MSENSDYQDTCGTPVPDNILTLLMPENREIAKTYVSMKVLDMARRFPEIRDDPFSAEIIDLCAREEYYPLDQIGVLEGIANESREELKKNCPDLYSMIVDSAEEMRNEYAHLVAASCILAKKWGTTPVEALLDPEQRDDITRLAFYDTDGSTGKEKIEGCLEKLFLQYRLIGMIDPVRGSICSRDINWQYLQEIMDVMPKKDVGNLLEKSCLFAQFEADRLYGSD